MTAEDLIQRLQAADPASDADFSADSPDARRLLERINDDSASEESGQRSRTTRTLALAAALLVGSTVAAAAAGLFSPDPADLNTILERAADHADVHGPGWRPLLNTEAVQCVYEGGGGASTYASEFPLDEPLTVDHLVEECTTGNDAVGTFGAPAEVTVCEGVKSDAYVAGAIEIGEVVAGSTTKRPGFPVVLGWDADCGDTIVDSSGGLMLREFTGVEAINAARELEIGFEASALQSCTSKPDALELAKQARTHLNNSWFVLAASSDVSPSCFRVDFDPHVGAIMIWGSDTPGAE